MFGLIILMSAPLVADPTFPETLTVNDTSYVQANSSSIKLLGIIKLTSASLYLGEGYSVEDYPGDIPLALRLRYDRNFKKEQLIGSADEILNDLYTAKQLAEIERALGLINSVYLDVDKGDEYTLIYDPSMGTTLLYNGVEKVTIPGERFAEIYFSIWLGDHPKSKKLSQALLK
jgi:hypothetical protein